MDDELEHFEEPARLEEESEEDAHLLLCDLVDLIDDEGHLVQVPQLLLELVPVARDVALLETVLVLHALLQDLHEPPQQDAELLVLRLLAEGKLVGERLRRLLVLLPQLGVEVQLVPLLYLALHHLYIIKKLAPDFIRTGRMRIRRRQGKVSS